VLKDKVVNVRRAAANSLKTLKWRPATAEERALFTIANGRARDAWREGEAAVDALVSELGNETVFFRRSAVAALEGIRDERSIGPLVAAMDDPDATVRVSAVHALGSIGGDRVIEELLNYIHDDSHHV